MGHTVGRRFPGRPCPFLSCEEDEKPLVSQSSLHFGFFLSLISLIGQTDFKAEISLFCSFPKNSLSHSPLWLPQAFLFSPQTTKAQRDQIKWHMNNGVFFIFNFPQVLLLMTIVFFFQVTPQLKPAITSFFQEIPLTYLNGRDLKDSFMILSDFSFIFLLRNFIYDMSPSAEKEIKITPYGGGIEGKHSPKIYPQGYSLSFLGHGLLKLHFRILTD